jgi:hypothetical protein
VLETAAAPAIPVLDAAGQDVVGWLAQQNVLAAMRGPGQPPRSQPDAVQLQPAR